MHRLFVAIRPPENVIDAMVDTMEGVDSARWQSDEQLHLTLRFVGEVERPVAEDLAVSLTGVDFAPFPLTIRGVGRFERKGRPHALWARVEPSAQLLDLQRRVESACRRAGLEPETRKYLPHVTLARLGGSGGGIAAWLAKHEDLRAGPFQARDFRLCESHLGRSGATYQDIARFVATAAG